jgi:hypothetical protein
VYAELLLPPPHPEQQRNVDTTGKVREGRQEEGWKKQPLDTLTSALCYKTRTARRSGVGWGGRKIRKISCCSGRTISVMFTIGEQRRRMRHINKQFKKKVSDPNEIRLY